MKHCEARSKQSGVQCRKAPEPGRNVCRIHGGATPRGLASADWKHGRYSKVLPPNLRDAYERARTDTELIPLRDELALLDARLGELVGSLADGGTVLWDDLGAAWANLEVAQRHGDVERTRTLLGWR